MENTMVKNSSEEALIIIGHLDVLSMMERPENTYDVLSEWLRAWILDPVIGFTPRAQMVIDSYFRIEAYRS